MIQELGISFPIALIIKFPSSNAVSSARTIGNSTFLQGNSRPDKQLITLLDVCSIRWYQRSRLEFFDSSSIE
jgi:hypothetical protein